MFNAAEVFSSFSVDNLSKAKEFYTDVLCLDVKEKQDMGLELLLGSSTVILVYFKKNHQPATHTILNFKVGDIDQAVDALTKKGIQFEQYAGELKTDKKGIFRGDPKKKWPSAAWFKDPAGNILALIKE